MAAVVPAPVIVSGTTLAATVELLKGMSAYSDAAAPPRQSDAFCAAVSATTSPTDSCRAVALEHTSAELLVTVTSAVPDLPSLDAVMVALPAATAVTRPLDDTVALVASDELHVTVRPVNVALAASRVTAVSGCVEPTRMLTVAGDTVTLATGTGMTVRVACPDLLPEVAVMVVCPAATAVIAPADEIEATADDEDDQVTVPTPMDAPFWSVPEALALAD